MIDKYGSEILIKGKTSYIIDENKKRFADQVVTIVNRIKRRQKIFKKSA